MRHAAPTAAELDDVAAEIRAAATSDPDPPPVLWAKMLDLIDTGNAPAARALLDRAWALDEETRETFHRDLVTCQLRRSQYWPDVAALNGWAAEPPPRDCPLE
jgi:hypothetical protein